MKLEGDKIILRDMHHDDLETLAKWMPPEKEWHRFNGPYYPPTPLEKIPDILTQWKKKIETGEWLTPRKEFVIAKKATNEMLGKVTRYWISEETHWLALGIVIYDPNNWQGGYGTEAFSLWVDYLFHADPRLVRLGLRTWSGNHGMMALAGKLGFTKEAVFRKARIVNDEYYDGLGYGILREEWESMR